VAFTVGIACGASIGFLRGRMLAACVAALVGATVGVIAYVSIIMEQSIKFGEWDRLRSYHLATFFVHYRILIRFVGSALVGTLPLACVGAVYDRRNEEVIVFPMVMCGGAVLFGGLIFFAYDVWTRGGFPRPPLPWPIALGVSLGSAVIGAALIGLATAAIWLVIRSTWRYVCGSLDVSLSKDHLDP